MELTPLGLADICTLADLIRGCASGGSVRWAPGGDSHSVLDGTLRAITGPDGAPAPPGSDIRERYLWVSAILEHFIPVPEVLRLLDTGLMHIDRA